MRWDPSKPPGKHPATLRVLKVHPGLFFPTGETKGLGVGGTLGVVVDWHEGGAMQSEFSPLSHHSEAVLLSLFCLGRCFSLIPKSWDFHNGVLSMAS